jgi:hypothetical protein
MVISGIVLEPALIGVLRLTMKHVLLCCRDTCLIYGTKRLFHF